MEESGEEGRMKTGKRTGRKVDNQFQRMEGGEKALGRCEKAGGKHCTEVYSPLGISD